MSISERTFLFAVSTLDSDRNCCFLPPIFEILGAKTEELIGDERIALIVSLLVPLNMDRPMHFEVTVVVADGGGDNSTTTGSIDNR